MHRCSWRPVITVFATSVLRNPGLENGEINREQDFGPDSLAKYEQFLKIDQSEAWNYNWYHVVRPYKN